MAAPSSSIHPSLIVLLVLVPLVVWRLYSRVRRLVGRQESRRWRHWATALGFPLLIGLIALIALGENRSAWSLAIGVGIGWCLALIALRKTRFETPADGAVFYTPYAPIGIALALVVVGRIAYRGYQIVEGGDFNGDLVRTFTASWLTLGIFSTAAAYYTSYAIGLLRWRRRLDAQRDETL